MVLAALAAVVFGLAPGTTAVSAAAPLSWSRSLHVPGVLDVAGPRSDGETVVAAAGRLLVLEPATGSQRQFAAGAGGYSGSSGGEPYIALSTGSRVASAGCSFGLDDLFVLQLEPAGGVLRIDGQGRPHPFATVDGVASLNGITFDSTGRFGGRLLVTGPSHGATVVAAIDCRGQVMHITDAAPVVEGGIAVAPAGFGAYGGDLVAPDELSGNLYAIRPDGSSSVLARSGLPGGGDIGVEGVGFVPAGFTSGGAAYFADRSTPGNPHPGTDSLLRLDGKSLSGVRVREGDLLAATEGGAALIAVHCGQTCEVTRIVAGDSAHGEGHLLVAGPGPATRGQVLPEASDLGRAALVQRLLFWGGAGLVAALVLTLVSLVVLRRRRASARRRG
ncbi:MAG: hypothetical protein DLM67_02680 [Candidatus Nephthysia bennettiae]|uniref:Uncharacterized protein n=1 Tax=Candidatus Nephthysia bennettiae TaxID=3127016 RepID=A0A934KAG4_9BACT|nr:hypothetical protein [Candidatus Dormibacteraeota bacterium]MBJ7614936.1 hypothetical protein [Candidatus Dormibacteraeota bacterium]PZR99950.1 MAG: hypothetical protein DLM67_02680 [Candidatus Dormibacteraeota bacterium]